MKAMESQETPPKFQTLVDAVRETAAKVRSGLERDLSHLGLLSMTFDQLGSYLYHASDKLLELKKVAAPSSRHDAVSLSLARLFSECFSAWELARGGFILSSTVLSRTAFEVATQTMMFIQNEEKARAWLNGKRYQPKDVRAELETPDELAAIYTRLTRLTHPNLVKGLGVPEHQSERPRSIRA